MKSIKIKNFTQELSCIEKFESFKKHKIIIDNCEGKAHITKAKKEFKLVYDGVFKYSPDNIIKATIDDVDYKFQSIDFKEPSNDIFANVSAQNTFDIDKVYKGDVNKVALFRMFFFDNSKRTNVFHTKLETVKNDGINTWAFDCVRTSVNQNKYDTTQYKNKDKSYFVIENLELSSLEKFEKDAYAIQKGIGFLIGYMPGGQNYIFFWRKFHLSKTSQKIIKIYFSSSNFKPIFKTAQGKEHCRQLLR